ASAAQWSRRSVSLVGYGPSGNGERAYCVPSGPVSRMGSAGRRSATPIAIPERAAALGQRGQERRRRPTLSELAMERDDPTVDPAQAGAIGVEHRSAAPRRKAVAIQVDDVDVRGALGEALVEDPRPLVDQRVDTSFDDLVVAERPLRDAGLPRRRANQRNHLGIRGRLALIVVEVPALAGLLTDAAHLVQLIGDQRLAFAGLGEMLKLLSHAV